MDQPWHMCLQHRLADIPDTLDADLPLRGSRPGEVIGAVEDNITALDSLRDNGSIGYVPTHDLNGETCKASDPHEAARQNTHMGMLLEQQFLDETTTNKTRSTSHKNRLAR
jgi:hypothetical protein